MAAKEGSSKLNGFITDSHFVDNRSSIKNLIFLYRYAAQYQLTPGKVLVSYHAPSLPVISHSKQTVEE